RHGFTSSRRRWAISIREKYHALVGPTCFSISIVSASIRARRASCSPVSMAKSNLSLPFSDNNTSASVMFLAPTGPWDNPAQTKDDEPIPDLKQPRIDRPGKPTTASHRELWSEESDCGASRLLLLREDAAGSFQPIFTVGMT